MQKEVLILERIRQLLSSINAYCVLLKQKQVLKYHADKNNQHQGTTAENSSAHKLNQGMCTDVLNIIRA